MTIREFARVIGKLVASEPGVQYAGLYYKHLEIERDTALKINRGNFDAKIKLSQSSKKCLEWWIDNTDDSFRPINLPDPDLIFVEMTNSYNTFYASYSSSFN